MATDRAQAQSGTETIQSRFGEVVIERDAAIYFAKGLVGMPDKFHFCITRLPHDHMAQFRLLQCVDDPDLSFIVLPVEMAGQYLEAEDVAMVSDSLGIPRDTLSIYLIVSVHRGIEGMYFSVNCVAPLFVNSRNRTGTQFVFSHTKYQVRQPLHEPMLVQ
jgi:flagellar assembly factor FliW